MSRQTSTRRQKDISRLLRERKKAYPDRLKTRKSFIAKIKRAEAEVKKGNVKTLEQVEKEMGIGHRRDVYR